jgi:preprotein translocase subunit YajC
LIVAASSGSGFFLIIIVAFLVLYMVVVRPQRRRQSAQQQLMSDLQVGDEVLTAGGIYGRVTRLDETEVSVEIAQGTEVRVARRAIATILREPEDEQPHSEETSEPDDSGDERWHSAFDDESSGEEKPG